MVTSIFKFLLLFSHLSQHLSHVYLWISVPTSSVNCGLPEGNDWVPWGVESSGYTQRVLSPCLVNKRLIISFLHPAWQRGLQFK